MKVSEEFLKAKNDKQLNSIVVTNMDLSKVPTIRLNFDCKNKFSSKVYSVDVLTETEFDIIDFKPNYNWQWKKVNVCFYEKVYPSLEPNSHMLTFLKAIKKDSDVRFKILANNNCDAYRNLSIDAHYLYGIVDNKTFLLQAFVGAPNSASPIQYNLN